MNHFENLIFNEDIKILRDKIIYETNKNLRWNDPIHFLD
jgi:hypothetical protein